MPNCSIKVWLKVLVEEKPERKEMSVIECCVVAKSRQDSLILKLFMCFLKLVFKYLEKILEMVF